MIRNSKDLKWILLVILAAILFRIFFIFFTPLQFSGADEAVVGIMAKHFLETGKIPLFQYGHSFGGTIVSQSVITAIFFLIMGISRLSLHTTAIFFSVVYISVAFIFTRRFFNKSVAIISSVLLAIPFPLFVYFTKGVEFHIISLIFDIVLVYLFFIIFYEGKHSSKNYILFGLLSVFSFWLIESVVPLLITFIIIWFLSDRKFFLKKGFLLYAGSFVIGYIPLLVYNLNNKFANIKHFFVQSIVHKIVCKYSLLPGIAYCLDTINSGNKNLIHFFTKNLPLFFGYGSLSYLIFSIFLISLFYVIYRLRKNIAYIAKNLLNFRKNISMDKISKGIVLVLSVFVFLFLYYMRGMDKQRYLVPTYFFIVLIISIFIADLLKTKGVRRFSGILIFSIMLLSNVIGLANLASQEQPETEHFSKIVPFLEQNNISRVYAEYWIKWPVIFESKEEIIASCDHMCYCLGEGRKSRYPLHEEIVNNSANFAYIVRTNSEYERRFLEYLDMNNVSIKIKNIRNFAIYYSISEEVRPWMIECTDNDIMKP